MQVTAKPGHIDFASFDKTHVPFSDMTGLVRAMSRTMTVMSWGAHAWTKVNDKLLRFMVQARRHHGHVYIAVNAGDLFDVIFTTNRGRITDKIEDVFIEDLISTIDEKIERIDAYKR